MSSDPAAKKMLEALRGVSAKVKSLPQELLGKDLKQQVLEQIQKRPPATLPQHDAHPGTSPETTSGQRRGLVWAGLALAAALMLMFFANPDREQRDPVAAADQRAKANKSNVKGAASDEFVAAEESSVEQELVKQELIVRPKATEEDESFGLAEAPTAPAQAPVAEVSDGVVSSRVMREADSAEPLSDANEASVELLEDTASDRLASQSSPATAPMEAGLDEASSLPKESDVFVAGLSKQRPDLSDRQSTSYEIVYEGEAEATLERFEQVLSQQGVTLRATTSEEREQLAVESQLREKGRKLELDSWHEAESEQAFSPPRLSKSLSAKQKRETDKSLAEIADEEQSESGESQAANEKAPPTGEAVLVEATPGQVARILTTWRRIADKEAKQRFKRNRSFNSPSYGGRSGGYGGEFGGVEYGSGEYGGGPGGGGGGYGGGMDNDDATKNESRQAGSDSSGARDAEPGESWAVRFLLRESNETKRERSPASRQAEPKPDRGEKSEDKDKRVRVLFYFRPAESK